MLKLLRFLVPFHVNDADSSNLRELVCLHGHLVDIDLSEACHLPSIEELVPQLYSLPKFVLYLPLLIDLCDLLKPRLAQVHLALELVEHDASLSRFLDLLAQSTKPLAGLRDSPLSVLGCKL